MQCPNFEFEVLVVEFGLVSVIIKQFDNLKAINFVKLSGNKLRDKQRIFMDFCKFYKKLYEHLF